MILLPLVPGLAALGLLLTGLDQDAWPLVVLGALLLAFSAWGRWPVTATLFCTVLVGAAVTQGTQSLVVDVGVGLLVAAYLLMVEAAESVSSLRAIPGWAAQQTRQILAAFVGVGVVALAATTPVVLALPTLVIAAVATAILFLWAASTISQ